MFATYDATQSPTVAGFGLSVIDVLMAAKSINLEEKNPVSHQAIQIGGVIPTALITLTRLGIRTQLHTVVGKDTLGDEILSLLKKEHIPLTNSIQTPDIATPFACVILHSNTGERTIFYTTGTFSTLTNSDMADLLHPNISFLLVDGHNCMISHAFILKARAQHARILLDLGNPKPGLEELAYASDVIIIPHAYWRIFPKNDPEQVVKSFLTKGPSLVIATMEEKGCLVGTKEKIFHQNTYPVHPVDANGTGDVFFGAFTYGLIKQWTLEKTAAFACAAAARSCSIFGKEEKIPHSEEEVFTFMSTHTPNG